MISTRSVIRDEITCAVDIHCYFSPHRHFHSVFNWMGPDIFSLLTSVTGIFHYLSVVLELETIEWLEIHFVAVRVETGEPATTVLFHFSFLGSSILHAALGTSDGRSTILSSLHLDKG